ncbi:MAG: GTPase HflX [Verrucomicrobia bacterium]|nr:GTPase HflX [Verrucomicrobiota bacterium]
MIDIKEKPKMVERAFLIGVRYPDESETTIDQLLVELEELVNNLGIKVVGKAVAKLRDPRPKFLLGEGKAQEMIEAAAAVKADCIVFDTELSPGQQRNWEVLSKSCVIDRHEVILDIFNERAQTREAILQVELARAEYSLPRLKNAWTHLSRQRGGGGVTQRGEGEAQIELDQRIVRERISKLKKELAEVIQHREVQRKQRLRVPLPTAAIVGYTNAGKSTLLNQMTGANVLAADKLFATLDPTTRQLQLPRGQKLLVTDTVGFVRRLPHRLVDAFKATLEEAVVADFLLHVVDISNPDAQAHMETTLAVLRELGAENKTVLTVYNKIDLCPEPERSAWMARVSDSIFPVSAVTGDGLPRLMERMEVLTSARSQMRNLVIPHDRYDVLNRLHDAGAINKQKVDDDGVHVVATIPDRLLGVVAEFEQSPNVKE